MQYYNCALQITNEFVNAKGKEKEIIDIIRPCFDRYIKICDKMSQAKIPAIVITGDEDILPVVFERINSKGSQLTKWQIYAATWSEEKIKVSEKLEKIVSYNRERYDSMEIDDDITLQEYDSIEIGRSAEVNIFELIFGFGKMISAKFPQLFTNTKSITEVNSIGFNLINACLAFKNNEIKKLPSNLREVIGNDDEINRFLLSIIECIELVDKAIAITTKFKSNIREDSSPLHTEMQICSMIANVFINKFMTIRVDENDTIIERKVHVDIPNPQWKEFREKFLRNLLVTYLIDILQINWRGSGDKRLNYIILNQTYYTRTISKEEFKSVLNIWFDNIKNERNEFKKIQNPKEADKVILNIIYSNILKASQQIDDSKYDIEHLATKGIMKKRLEKFRGGLRLPISSIGNVCLLPEEYNRGKGEKTIYQYEDPSIMIEQIEQNYSFTKLLDMEWLNNENISKEELEIRYNNFINNRFDIIKEKLIEVLYNE